MNLINVGIRECAERLLSKKKEHQQEEQVCIMEDIRTWKT